VDAWTRGRAIQIDVYFTLLTFTLIPQRVEQKREFKVLRVKLNFSQKICYEVSYKPTE